MKLHRLENTPEKEEKNSIENLFGSRDIEKKFIEQRKVFIWGGVDDKSAKDIVNRMLYLDSIDNKKEIKFYINSPGGMVSSGMVIYDVMQLINSPVHTICMGLAASMGSILLSAGAKGHRYIFPHGEVMIHQPSISGFYQGTTADLVIQAQQIHKTKLMGAKILAQHCSVKIEQILNDFDRDYWMNAEESLKYGIVDKIIKKID